MTEVDSQAETSEAAPIAAFHSTPHLLVSDFLAPGQAQSLLEYAMLKYPRFQAGGVGAGQHAKINPEIRKARVTSDLAQHRDVLRLAVKAELPRLLHAFGMRMPVEWKLEMSLVGYRDGDFYGRHIDTQTNGKPRDLPRLPRLLSCIYYVYREPKGFEGGQLRLHSISRSTQVDIEPRHNMLAVFPSWMTHEVLPVRVATDEAGNYRFGVNIWFRGTYKHPEPIPED
ncbi:MAG: 2OG-Fe(II) oxygenase [Pseudomonadota bacterium]|nr:2OG-Fe(II) oxygenase [Pseudomonadota bacterium]